MIYRLPLELTREQDVWMARSPAVPGLLVIGDTLDQVLSELPTVTQALFDACQAQGWVFVRNTPEARPSDIVWDLELPHASRQAA
jgi:predicted RNase H-like HicB family nuclease